MVYCGVYSVGMVVDRMPEMYARVNETILHELLAANDDAL
jgi:hypothetical protein